MFELPLRNELKITDFPSRVANPIPSFDAVFVVNWRRSVELTFPESGSNDTPQKSRRVI